jgi:hypothetical protein
MAMLRQQRLNNHRSAGRIVGGIFSLISASCMVIARPAITMFAKPLSDFEEHLRERRPGTKVTGWSGTQKGVWAWRFVGTLVILLGFFIAFDFLPRILR